VDILKQLNFQEMFSLLRSKRFFTSHEDEKMQSGQEKNELFMTVLKEKSMQCIINFLSYLKELPRYNALVSKIEDEIKSFKNDLHIQIPAPANSALDVFQQYLIQRYTSDNFLQAHNIISPPTVFHINLALINNTDNKYFDFSDYSMLYEQKSNRAFLESYSDIFTDHQAVVVLQGPPGSGKTTLAKHLCKQWANGELLQTFSHVIFVQLRDERIAKSESFEDLIKLYMNELGKCVAKEIFKIHGKGFLIILEGWDELTKEIRCSNFTMFRDLMLRKILPNAVIAITTCSSTIANLPADVTYRRIEIVGFTKQQVEEYVDNFMDHDRAMIKRFWNQLDNLPHISNILFIPINLCIILNIFQKNNQKIPHTYTELYTKFLLSQLSIYYFKRKCLHAIFESLDNLPPDISEMVLNFGKMGYYCLLNSKLNFSEKEISDQCFNSKGIPLELNEVAILELHTIVNGAHVSKTYQFVHRTLQELLAAWYLSQQTIPFQQNAIKKYFKEKELQILWIFYAGLTKFNPIPFDRVVTSNYIKKFKSLFSSILLRDVGRNAMKPVNAKNIVTTFFTTKFYAYSISNSVPNDFQITLLAAAKESQNPEICKALCNSYIFSSNTCWLTIPENGITPQIVSALSSCMAHGGKKWIIQCKKLDNSAADCLLEHLACSKSVDCSCNNCDNFSDRTDNKIFALDLSSSQYPVVGLVKLIKTQKFIQWIILSRSEYVNDSLMIELTEALKENTCLKMLHLFACNITSVGVKAIADMLKENSTLEWIGLRDNRKTLKEEDIILLLETINSYNTAVYMLILDSIFHAVPNVQELLATINANRNNARAEKLCIRIEDCLRFSNACHRISSFIQALREQ